jgi:RimJ/RimL family protein N-acetyltransferase
MAAPALAPPELAVPPTVLRRWRATDAPALVRVIDESRHHLRRWTPWVAGDPDPADGLGDIEWRRGWLACIEQTFDDGEAYDYAISDGDVLVGGCSLHALDEGPLVGYWIHPAHTRRGHATRATRGLIGLARQLGFPRIQLRCDAANEASARVARRLGFTIAHCQAGPVRSAGQPEAWLVFTLDLR